MIFSDAQVKDAVKRVRAEAGPAWPMLGERFQRALIAERALLWIGSQAADSVPTGLHHSTLARMLAAAGIE